ncbi:MAG: hypothetical protein Q4A83_05635 [Bacillota bacterium]|nr:hypothetical protein [Bacillota bacterium]
MREKLARFMAGRYGNDQLNKTMAIASCVGLLLSLIFRGSRISTTFWLLAVVLLVLVYVRMMSKNRYKRIDENNKYLKFTYNLSGFFRIQKERWVQRNDYKFFKCPGCGTTLRVPRGKGKISIVCKKCGNSFRGKT